MQTATASTSSTVYAEEGEALADSLGIPFFSTSALTGQGIELVFTAIAGRMFTLYEAKALHTRGGSSTTSSSGSSSSSVGTTSGPGRPPLGPRAASAAPSAGNSTSVSGAGRPDWRSGVSSVDIEEVEQRGLRLHREKVVAEQTCFKAPCSTS